MMEAQKNIVVATISPEETSLYFDGIVDLNKRRAMLVDTGAAKILYNRMCIIH